MNREIKFRGKRADNGEWVYGDLIHKQSYNLEILLIRVFYDEFGNYIEYEVIPETVGQYTGLKDKKGVEIYEGDIITRNSYTGYIKYRENGFYIICDDSYGEEMLNEHFREENVEVIGNIWDNPELLEVKYE